jgi:hypothetical protein
MPAIGPQSSGRPRSPCARRSAMCWPIPGMLQPEDDLGRSPDPPPDGLWEPKVFSDQSLYRCAAPYGVKIPGARVPAGAVPGLLRLRFRGFRRAGYPAPGPRSLVFSPSVVRVPARSGRMTAVPPVTPFSPWPRRGRGSVWRREP